MPWSPVYQATDIRKILGNLITFFEANQVEALAWASPTRNLTALTFYKNAEVRMKHDFPHFGVVKRAVKTDDADSGLVITYSLTFEIEIEATHPEKPEPRKAALEQLQIDTDNYCYAVESMFLNITNAALFANINGVGHGYRTINGSDPLEVAISNVKTLFNVQMTAILEFTENPR